MGRWTELLDRIMRGTEEEAPPFVRTLNLPQITRWEEGRVWLDWEVDPAFFHPGDALFGGYLAALADHALGFPVWTVLGEDEGMTTSNLQVSFFRPVPAGRLHIESRVVNRGRTMVHVEALFTRDDGKLAAVATATQVIVKDAT